MTRSEAITKAQFIRVARNPFVMLHPKLTWRYDKATYAKLDTDKERGYDRFIIDEFSFKEGAVPFGEILGVYDLHGGGENIDVLGLIFPSACYDLLLKQVHKVTQ